MDKIKTIAMYLPQFHEVSENSKWWGEGYTEWTAVKNAEKLFEGHNQPREPLEDNYYNLLDKTTMNRQAELAKLYGLDGFCFYHYYFKNGRKILEKPAENLLEWIDLDMPFCFCWANEGWARTWSKMNLKNVWSDKFESIEAKSSEDILLEQKYGREKEWRIHFEYLLPFFRDDRYIKKDGRPIFLITIPGIIPCLAEMINYWKLLAKENGINDIYIIGMSTNKKLGGLDAVLVNAPSMYLKTLDPYWKNGIKNYKYEDVWKKAVEYPYVLNCPTYFGGFTDYDDTPRRGEKGTVLDGRTMEIFEKYLFLLMKKNILMNNEFFFINAFNEWGEGMYLEPDKREGYRYLEILNKVKERVNDEDNTEFNVEFEQIKSDKLNEVENEKLKLQIRILDEWMMMREEGVNLSKYLKRHNYNEVAIYGMGLLGKHLLSELLEGGIKVKYVIDRRKQASASGVKLCTLDFDLEKVDAIIITPIFEYDRIWEDLRSRGISFPIVSLLELIEDE